MTDFIPPVVYRHNYTQGLVYPKEIILYKIVRPYCVHLVEIMIFKVPPVHQRPSTIGIDWWDVQNETRIGSYDCSAFYPFPQDLVEEGTTLWSNLRADRIGSEPKRARVKSDRLDGIRRGSPAVLRPGKDCWRIVGASAMAP